MKKGVFAILSVLSFMAVLSCSSNKTNVRAAAPYTYTANTAFNSRRVSVDVAKSNIDTAQHYMWAMINLVDSVSQAPVQTTADSVIAFKVHAGDLFAALGVLDTVNYSHAAVRIYFGFDKQTQSFKLYVVPSDTVAQSGFVDRFFNSSGQVVPYDPKSKNYVMDLNTPCPPTCDCNSPLMVGLRKQ